MIKIGLLLNQSSDYSILKLANSDFLNCYQIKLLFSCQLIVFVSKERNLKI